MGELAALATSFCWSFTSVQFTLAGRRVGSQIVNRVRLVLAVLFLTILHLLMQGQLWPLQAESFRCGWLALSGVVGLVLGDSALFQAFLIIGPRRSMLMMTLAPVLSTIMAWLWLGETLRWQEVAAILITVAGIAWVVSERKNKNGNGAVTADGGKPYLLGILLGLGAALGQSLGLVIAIPALADDFSTLSATLMRMLAAMLAIWLITFLRGEAKKTVEAVRDRRALGFLIGGAFTGPTLGVWMSLTAVQLAPVGIASTLMALPPILLIPLSRGVFKEEISRRALVGTVIALTGAALIFLI